MSMRSTSQLRHLIGADLRPHTPFRSCHPLRLEFGASFVGASLSRVFLCFFELLSSPVRRLPDTRCSSASSRPSHSFFQSLVDDFTHSINTLTFTRQLGLSVQQQPFKNTRQHITTVQKPQEKVPSQLKQQQTPTCFRSQPSQSSPLWLQQSLMLTDTRNSTPAISRFRSQDDRTFKPLLWMAYAAVTLVSAVKPGTAARSMVTVVSLQSTVELDVNSVRVMEVLPVGMHRM